MLHRNYVILVLLALIFFTPQATLDVLAEDNTDKSVYENLNQGETQKEEENNELIEEQVNPDPDTAVQGDALTVTAFDFIKMFFALGLVLFLIYFLLKFVTKRNRVFQQGKAIINLGGTNIGQNKSVQMVKVANRVLVIGVGESITLLKEIDEKESKTIIEDFEQKQENVVETDFIQKITSVLNKGTQGTNSIKPNEAFSSRLNEQLQKIKAERTKQIEDIKRKGLNKHE